MYVKVTAKIVPVDGLAVRDIRPKVGSAIEDRLYKSGWRTWSERHANSRKVVKVVE